ncbi:DUF6881 domain-containing protein [Pendulispora rubella]|uniref:DUF6881 domain-containing protein n=1 Tax=Pendulispora rubella TaxID=2741070 RepID=UPI00374E1AA9
MNYIRVNWRHSHPDEPITLYSELNAERWEVRKVEVFKCGRYGFAGTEESSGDTKLGEMPVPDLDEIATDPQFEPAEITREEFEDAWNQRHSVR